MKKAVIVLTLSVLASSGLFAAEDVQLPDNHYSFHGPTGLIFQPTAYSTPRRALSLNGGWFQDRARGVLFDNIIVSGTYGFDSKVEGGFFYNRRYNGIATDDGGGFVKFVLSEEGAREPAFAVGGSVGGGDQQPISAYFVLSRTLNLNTGAKSGKPISGHVGVRYDRVRNFPVPGPRSSGITPYGGLDFHVAQRTSVLAEVRRQQPYETKTVISAAVKHSFSNRFGLTAGVTNAGLTNGLRPLVMISIFGGIPKGE
jgi:hypothetical protein